MAKAFTYAGFWRRFMGWVIDHMIMNAGWAMLSILVFGSTAVYAAYAHHVMAIDGGWLVNTLVSGSAALYFFLCIGWGVGYYTILMSSPRCATVGMMAMGMKILDENGQRMSWARAFGRLCATLITAMTFGLGYLVQLWTARRQTIHDLIAGTIVVKD